MNSAQHNSYAADYDAQVRAYDCHIADLACALTGGRKTIAGLLGRLKIWQVRWEWWVAASIVQPVLLLAIALAYNMLGGNPASSLVAHGILLNSLSGSAAVNRHAG